MTAKKTPQDHKKPAIGEPQEPRRASAYSDEVDPAGEITYDGQHYTTRPARLVTDVDALEAMHSASTTDNPVLQAAAMGKVARAVLADDFEKFKADQISKHGFCSVIALQEIVDLISETEGNSHASPTS